MEATTLDILAGSDQFEQYERRVTALLATKRQEQTRFLERAIAELETFLQEARILADREMEQDLAGQLEAARARLGQLSAPAATRSAPARAEVAAASTGSPVPAAPPVPTPVTGTQLAPRSAPASVTAKPPSTSPAAAPVTAPAARPAAAPAARPASAPVPRPTSTAPPIPRLTFIPPAPPPPPRPVWTPRPVSELDAEVSRLEEQLEAGAYEGEIGLLRLKALACRQRRAFWELEEQGAYSGQSRALYGAVKSKVTEKYGERRVLPLNTGVVPLEPARWEGLAAAYESLIPALEAFAWYEEHAAPLGPATSRELLECVGSVQQQFYRYLEEHFCRATDDQQRTLYEALLAAGEDQHVFLESLNPRRTEAELQRTGSALQKTYLRLREGQEKKAQQQASTEQLLDLTSRPDFGTQDADATRLREAAAACLKSGVPASNKPIRDALLPWIGLLEDEPELAPLLKEIERELDRRMVKGQALEVTDADDDDTLSEEVHALLAALVPHTRGKRVLFIGGDNREEKRRKIQAAMELSELVWPQARRTFSVYEFEAEIARCDIICLLIRFMRTGFKQAVEISHKYGTKAIRIPRGLGLSRVITDFHQQIVPRGESGGS